MRRLWHRLFTPKPVQHPNQDDHARREAERRVELLRADLRVITRGKR